MSFRAPVVCLVLLLACARTRADAPALSDGERAATADTIKALIINAYDLARPGNAVTRLMSLYPETGRIVSASGGHISTTRDTLEMGIRAFWDNVGKNMREPKWQWGEMQVDVLARTAAVVTATYRVPHITPSGEPHVIAGAWTAVFQKRGPKWVIVQEHLSDLAAPH